MDHQLRQSRLLSWELASAARYLALVNREMTELWVENQRDKKFGLPFISEQVMKLFQFAQIQKECELLKLSWMATGCLQVERNKVTVKNYIEKTIPFNIKVGLNIIREEAPDWNRQELASVDLALKSGEILHAARIYDSILQAASEDFP